MPRGVSRCVVGATGVLAGLCALSRWSRRSGVTDEEAAGPLPGDELIPHPMLEWTRGITIGTSPAQVWPWLVQMGYHRAGWYTSEWLDRVIWRVDARNADRILADCQSLSVGDVVPDGPDFAAYFWVRELEPERAIVYSSTRHPYRGHPIDPSRYEDLLQLEEQLIEDGRYLDFSWSFVLQPVGPESTRLLIRTRANYAPAAIRSASIPLGLIDAYFAHSILRGIKTRAEANGTQAAVASE